MADVEIGAEDPDSMIQELLDAGFSYTQNGRVDGFAQEINGEIDEDLQDEHEAGLEEPDETPDETPDDEPERGAHSGRLELRGTPLTETEADGLLHLRKLLIDHPDLAAEVNALAESRLRGTPPPPAPAPVADEAPVDQPESLPEFIDPDDEQAVALWREVSEARRTAERAAEVATGTVEQVQAEAHHSRVQSDIQSAVERFRTMHPDLSEEDIQSVRNHTAATVNIPGVMGNFPGDPVEGLVRAMEIGSYTDETVRDKVLGTAKKDTTSEDAKRQRSLSALSGSSGSGSRRPAPEKKPAGWADVAKELAKGIEALGGTN